jgi:phytoene desaturase
MHGATESNGLRDVAVVGGGLGGLSCAALLAKAGLDVVLFERSAQVGGVCTSFRRNDFLFDAGPTTIKSCDQGEEVRSLLQDLELWDDLAMVRPDPGVRVVGEGYDLCFAAGQSVFATLAEQFPREREALVRFEAECAALVEELAELTATPPDLLSFGQKLALAPKLLLRCKHLKRYASRTTREVLDDFFREDSLKTILSALACPFPPATSAALFLVLVHGARKAYHYPRGGTVALAEALEESIAEHGGTVATRAEVTAIEVDQGRATRVELADGRSVPCRFVVSNGDARHTFLELIGREHLPSSWTRPIESDPVTDSYVLVSLGLDRDLREEGHVAPLICFSRCCELDRTWGADVELCPVQVRIPSLIDDTLAPPGHSVVQILAFLPYDFRDCWGREADGSRGTRYREIKEEIAQCLISSVERIVPGLSGQVVCRDVATPLTYERYTLSTGGASGWLPRPGDKMRSQRTPIRNLFQAGQWTYPGAGVPTVLSSGRTAADLILREDAKHPWPDVGSSERSDDLRGS